LFISFLCKKETNQRTRLPAQDGQEPLISGTRSLCPLGQPEIKEEFFYYRLRRSLKRGLKPGSNRVQPQAGLR
jgi:hypothetical protein